MKTSWSNTIRIILFSAVLGGAAGVLTTALTTNYLADYALELGQITEPLRLTETRPMAFPSSYEESLTRVKEEVFPAMTTVLNQPTSVVSPSAVSQQVATVMTSDGWLMVYDDQGFTQVRVGDEVCPIQERVDDVMTGVTFVHCEAQALPVIGFGSAQQMVVGEQVFIVGAQDRLTRGAVAQIQWGRDVSKPSDEPTRRLAVAAMPGAKVGDSVFDLSGKLIGIVESAEAEEDLIVLAFDAVLPALETLLAEGVITRPALGMHVVHLSDALVVSDDVRGRRVGAWVYGVRAVEIGGPAADAGLRTGDIVLAVNGELVNSTRSLDELIMTHDAGDVVTLTVDREAVEIDIEVTLGQWSN